MPDSLVTAVAALRVDAIHVAHEPRQVGSMRLEHKVVMIGHEAIGQTARIEALQSKTKNFK